ncbi:SDR family oxidoreductase [Sphingosinithalassobacter portus]|uniref:SDR family oxidoreductase n=1 Tax=Stakelama portus TaxID=2676234 RepID=UPI000D6EAC05|nr:SDR family oxidoreductase [Sphingosinithalassobacter portus]
MGSGQPYADRKTVYAADALAGQTVLISGGSGGIGQATAWLFARLGARIVITGRDAEKLSAVAGALTDAGHRCASHPLDIRDPEAVETTLAQIWRDHGPIDALINSAGGQFPQAAIDFSVKGWQRVIDVNLNGSWFMMQAMARHWRDAGRPGSITNIVVVTSHGLYGVAHSVAARAGVIGLSRSVAVEWAPLGIRVNCIAPGLIETDGWRVYSPEVRARYARSNPMMRPGDAWDVAEACAYLAAPSGNYVTGEVLTVDGGGQLWGETWTIPKPEYFNTEG